MSDAEAPQIKMQLVRDGEDDLFIDIEPPLSDEQKALITGAHEFYDIPDDAFVFRDYSPEVGNPFTEVDCGAVEAGLQEKGLEFNEGNFARKIAELLTAQGNVVAFDPAIKPLEQSGYLFPGGLTAVRPQ